MYGNDDTQCPEKNGGKNVSRLYIDSSEPSVGASGTWTADDTLDFKCLEEFNTFEMADNYMARAQYITTIWAIA